MKIQILGTGAADSIKYFHSSFFIKSNDNSKILLDTGGGYRILNQIKELNIKLEDINNIFISHIHIDHILGSLWLLRKIGSKISKGEMQSLNIYAPKNVLSFFSKSLNMLLKKKVTDQFDNKIKFIELKHLETFEIGNLNIKPFNIQSDKDEQFGFLIGEENKNILFLGDEPYQGEIFDFMKSPHLLLHDSYCLQKHEKEFNPAKMHHSTVSQAAEFASSINAQALLLHHTEEIKTIGKRKKLYTKEAKKYFSGKIYCPNDLEEIVI